MMTAEHYTQHETLEVGRVPVTLQVAHLQSWSFLLSTFLGASLIKSLACEFLSHALLWTDSKMNMLPSLPSRSQGKIDQWHRSLDHTSDREAKPDPGGTCSEWCGEENPSQSLWGFLGSRPGLFLLPWEYGVCLKCWTDRIGVDGMGEGMGGEFREEAQHK